VQPLQYLYAGLNGHTELRVVMWISSLLAAIALVLLLSFAAQKNERTLLAASLAVFISIWLDKGFCFVVSGFIPNPFDRVTGYWPTLNEFFVAAGCWGIGFLVLTVLYKIVISVREGNAE